MIVQLAVDAMGTRFELVLYGQDAPLLRAAGEEAIDAILEEHHRLSIFAAASHISRINAQAASQPVGMDADLFALLSLAERVWQESAGAFDPAVSGLMQKWGHRGEQDAHPTGLHEAEGERSGTAVGFAGVVLDHKAGTIAFTQPGDGGGGGNGGDGGTGGVGLDLGGIAKGYALDRAAAILREAGGDAGLLHGGTSSIVAIGSPPGAHGWRIKLGCPAMANAPAALMLRDMAASVSAPDGRVSDTGAGHIIDPRTGRPATAARAAVTCGTSCTLADAWATALVVLGDRPGRMPTAIGSAVLTTAGGWTVCPTMTPIFENLAQGLTTEHDR